MVEIRLFISRTCGNMIMHLQQAHIRRILEMKSIKFEEIDIADPSHAKDKTLLKEAVQSEVTVLPPQIFNGPQYKGDFEGFFTAVECERLFEYLGLPVPLDEVEAMQSVE